MKTRNFKTDYDYDLITRYGEDKPLYQPMLDSFSQWESNLFEFSDAMISTAPDLMGIPLEAKKGELIPFWKNDWFGPLDAIALASAIKLWNPAKYVEIGSGVSTRFARYSIDTFDLATQLTSIDPYPRMEVDQLCDHVIRCPLEEYKGDVFEELKAGDILFFDGSHRCFQNSDVTVFFLEILPRLQKGVHVHIHDIFWPEDYPSHWTERVYNEQYLLALLFQSNHSEWKIEYGCRYVAHNEKILERYYQLEKLTKETGIYVGGGSFWMTKI